MDREKRRAFSVTREITSDQKLDSNTQFGVAEVLTFCEPRKVTASLQLFMDLLHILPGDNDVDDFRKSTKSVPE